MNHDRMDYSVSNYTKNVIALISHEFVIASSFPNPKAYKKWISTTSLSTDAALQQERSAIHRLLARLYSNLG